jgi:hypothetical protein
MSRLRKEPATKLGGRSFRCTPRLRKARSRISSNNAALRSKNSWRFCNAARASSSGQRTFIGLKRTLDAGVHFFFFDEFTAIGLLDALSDASSKACVIVQQPQRRILHQLCWVHAFLRGNSGETCLFFGGESDFHDSSD